MNRSEWAERLPLIQAFVEGKEIQYKWPKGGWADVGRGSNVDFSNALDVYRIKPEPKVLYCNENKEGMWHTYDTPEEAQEVATDYTVRVGVKFVEVVE